MSVNLGNPTWVTLVADTNTPAELQQYNGWKVGVPGGVTLPTTLDSIVVSGVTVWGYARNGGTEWVMQPQQNPVAAAILAIPGPAGWLNAQARDVYLNQGMYLLQNGTPGDLVASGLTQFYQAAIAEHMTEHPAP